MRFDALHLPEPILQALQERGYETATPVQSLVLAPELAGQDLLVSSRTGSGKTLAFGLSLVSTLLEERGKAAVAGHPLSLVVAPTRELALQVARELTWVYQPSGVRIATCVGGMDIRREIRSLDYGTHIVVGTPGRVCDHLERGSLRLDRLQSVVIDEADEMLDLGFRDELEQILRTAPTPRRTLLFSATLPHDIQVLSQRYTHEAHRVEATSIGEQHGDIEYIVHQVAPREREHAVVNTLRYWDPPSALVFCATREGVSHLHASLLERGFSAVCLSGELSQSERNRALAAMREGRARVLVATDVAARGIDLPAVGLVVHADLPHDAAVLQHRSGRTGRAGRKGTAVLVVPFPRVRQAERLLKVAKIEARWENVASSDDVRTKDQQRLVDEIAALSTEVDPEDVEVARTLLALHPPEWVASLWVRDRRRRLPAPEELPMTATWRQPPRREAAARKGYLLETEGEGAWFRVNVGRDKNADPRWLVPMLCRRGHVRKRDIGRIEIGARETRFEVHLGAARQFEDASRKPDKKDPDIFIESLRGAGKDTVPPATPPRRQRPVRQASGGQAPVRRPNKKTGPTKGSKKKKAPAT